jgi:hypothetical protein
MSFESPRRTITTMGGQLALFALVVFAGCARDTSTLTPAWQQRFQTEGIVRRADNVIVRHTREGDRWDNSYKDRLASVILTHGTILIHQGERVLLEVTPRTRREISVTRQGGRIRIRAVGERVTEIFSFEAKQDAAGWAEDLRTVVKLESGSSE